MGGSLVAGILTGDAALIGKALDSDAIVEPVRGPLIPGFAAVKEAARAAGAFGCTISGAGPTAVAIVSDPEVGFWAGGLLGSWGAVWQQPPRLLAVLLCCCWRVYLAAAGGAGGRCLPGTLLLIVPHASAPLPLQVGERVKEALVAAFKAAGKLEVNSAKVVRLDNEGAKRV